MEARSYHLTCSCGLSDCVSPYELPFDISALESMVISVGDHTITLRYLESDAKQVPLWTKLGDSDLHLLAILHYSLPRMSRVTLTKR